jgi:hypothetical protein
LELSLGISGKSTVVTIQLASQMKAGASIKRSGEAEDNTYAPRTGLGVELIESDGNGLADTLRCTCAMEPAGTATKASLGTHEVEGSEERGQGGKPSIRKIGRENRPTIWVIATSKPNQQPKLRNS